MFARAWLAFFVIPEKDAPMAKWFPLLVHCAPLVIYDDESGNNLLVVGCGKKTKPVLSFGMEMVPP
jgi:hypothetical protein